MKKLIILIIALAVLCGLGYFAMTLSEKDGRSDLELIDFAIEDIESIDKIIITDRSQRSYTLIRKGKTWTNSKGDCVVQEKVDWALDAIKNVRFKGYLTDKSVTTFTKLMSAQHTKVEIFQNGVWTKTWFIGPSTQDHMGQIMLLETSAEGKSADPVQVHLTNMKGIIEPRFFADPYQWQCTDIFKVPIEKIASVNVKFNDEPQRSFKVEKNGEEIDVFQRGKKLSGFSPQNAYKYLHGFQKVHWETANYILNKKQVDSVKRSVPFCELTLNETNGKRTYLKMYRIQLRDNDVVGNAEIINPDLNNFWCELPGGRLVKCQYFVFNPLILGHVFFPMDLTGIQTLDGMREAEVPK